MSSLIRERAASTPEMIETFGDASLLRAALAFEGALAQAEADEELILPSDAAKIAEVCEGTFDAGALAEQAAHAGTLAIPLVAELRARLGATPAAQAVHMGATSQDLADTALMLQAKAGVALIQRDLTKVRRAIAALAESHAETPMVGRTLMQPATPITFGLKAVAWVLSLDAATERLAREARSTLALQFGGAAGTRAGLRGRGASVAARMSATLGLADPLLPWHARRDGLAGLGAALAIIVGVLGKVARDISLMTQREVGEAFEPRVPGRGGSSAMAHKRNPTGCQEALSAAARAPGLAATLFSTLPGEHERGLGGWQAEGAVLADLFLLTHGTVAALTPVVAELEVDAVAMARNLKAADLGDDTGEAKTLIATVLAHRKKAD